MKSKRGMSRFLVASLLLWFCLLAPKEAMAPKNTHLKLQKWPIIIENALVALPITFEKPIKFGEILSCLAYEESKNNPKAKGPCGEIGILQFLPKTFEIYCIDKYSLTKDKSEIFNPQIQFKCADLMLQERWSNIYHWVSAKRCLKNFGKNLSNF